MRIVENRDSSKNSLIEQKRENSRLLSEVDSLRKRVDAFGKINHIIEKKLYLQTVFNEIIENAGMIDNYYDLVRNVIEILRRLFDFRLGALYFSVKSELFLFDDDVIDRKSVNQVKKVLESDIKSNFTNYLEIFNDCSDADIFNSYKLFKMSDDIISRKSGIGNIVFFFSEEEHLNEYRKSFKLVSNALGLVFGNFFMNEKNKLYQRHLSSQLELFQNLYNISLLSSEETTINDKLKVILGNALSEISGNGGSVQLIDERTNYLYIRVAQGLDDNTIKNFSLKVGTGIVGSVAKTGEPLVIYQNRTKPSMKCVKYKNMEVDFARIYEKGERKNTKAAICMPMRASKRIVGVFNVTSRERVFNDTDLDIIGLYASLAAQLYENNRLNEKNERQVSLLSMLNKTGAEFLKKHKEMDQIELAINTISKIVPADFSAVFTLRGNVVSIKYGLYKGKLSKKSQGLAKKALLSILDNDDYRLKRNKFFKLFPKDSKKYISDVKSFFIIPLRFQGKIRGGMGIFCEQENAFLPEEIEVFNSLCANLSIAILNTRVFESMQMNYFNTISVLAAAIDTKDHYTHSHSQNVMKMSVKIAEEMRLPPIEREYIMFAGLLHDIGKIGIDDTILRKTSALNNTEKSMIKQHPELGANILKGINLFKLIAPLSYHHHEKYDGTGYPDGLKGKDIPLGSRILSVADAFDAMTSDRPYHRSNSIDEAVIEIVKESGKHFDPDVVKAFVKVIKGEKHTSSFKVSKILSYEFLQALEEF